MVPLRRGQANEYRLLRRTLREVRMRVHVKDGEGAVDRADCPALWGTWTAMIMPNAMGGRHQR